MANNSFMSFASTTKAKLDTVPLKEGQLIFVYDYGEIYLDLHDERKPYSDFVILPSHEERMAITTPIPTFYYIAEDNSLWRFESGEWKEVSSVPSISFEELDAIFGE